MAERMNFLCLLGHRLRILVRGNSGRPLFFPLFFPRAALGMRARRGIEGLPFSERPMKILFASPFCLLDPSSGASITCRTILEGLAARGHQAHAVSACVFDRPQFATSEEFLGHIGARPLGNKTGPRSMFWQASRDGVGYVIAQSRAQLRSRVTCAEALAYQRLFVVAVRNQRPDAVLVYGGKPVDRDNYRWLHERGIPAVFYVANPNYWDRRTFRDIDLILTDTEATAALYKKRLGVVANPIGKIVKPFPQGPDAPRDCVTLVNPAPEKGASVFLGIVREAARRGLDARFLVVESRRRLAETANAIGIDAASLTNIECVGLQEDMSNVWRRTKVLLHPSLWHESGSRLVVEACSAGVPVLATSSGGIPETLGEAGFLFPVPPELSEKYALPAAPETIATWTDTLEKLLRDETFYASASERALQHWKARAAHDPFVKIEAMLEKTVARKKERVQRALAAAKAKRALAVEA